MTISSHKLDSLVSHPSFFPTSRRLPPPFSEFSETIQKLAMDAKIERRPDDKAETCFHAYCDEMLALSRRSDPELEAALTEIQFLLKSQNVPPVISEMKIDSYRLGKNYLHDFFYKIFRQHVMEFRQQFYDGIIIFAYLNFLETTYEEKRMACENKHSTLIKKLKKLEKETNGFYLIKLIRDTLIIDGNKRIVDYDEENYDENELDKNNFQKMVKDTDPTPAEAELKLAINSRLEQLQAIQNEMKQCEEKLVIALPDVLRGIVSFNGLLYCCHLNLSSQENYQEAKKKEHFQEKLDTYFKQIAHMPAKTIIEKGLKKMTDEYKEMAKEDSSRLLTCYPFSHERFCQYIERVLFSEAYIQELGKSTEDMKKRIQELQKYSQNSVSDNKGAEIASANSSITLTQKRSH